MDIKFTDHEGKNIREALAGAGVSFDCGGNGTCGKCRIRVLSGSVPVTEADRAFFGEDELKEGYRLGCRIDETSLNGDIEIAPVVAGSVDANAETGAHELSERDYAFAIDIGTTTVCIAAVDMRDGTVFDMFTCMNSQRMYGADVVSRIVASNNGMGAVLKSLVIEDINRGTDTLMKRNGLRIERLEKIVITGNTAMEHIFAGYSCEGLGMAPFEAVSLDGIETSSGFMLPGISVFVGADILAGMCAVDGFTDDRISLFLDIGTNAEMAIGNAERVLVASAAAGPAFEGGNISCGCAGVEGAICDVELSDDDNSEPVMFRLIGDGSQRLVSSKDCRPKGICGSGVISLAAELLDEGIIDETGMIDERLRGKIKLADGLLFTQKDIRELQLAKAAVRAGIETLLHEYGVSYSDIDRVFIAGSFGKAIDVRKAVRIGLIPAELGDKCIVAGNTALAGVVEYITKEDVAAERMKHIKAVSQEIVLADSSFFAGAFIDRMNF